MKIENENINWISKFVLYCASEVVEDVRSSVPSCVHYAHSAHLRTDQLCAVGHCAEYIDRRTNTTVTATQNACSLCGDTVATNLKVEHYRMAMKLLSRLWAREILISHTARFRHHRIEQKLTRKILRGGVALEEPNQHGSCYWKNAHCRFRTGSTGRIILCGGQ